MAEKIKLFSVDSGQPKEVRTLPELLQELQSGKWTVDPLPTVPPPVKQETKQDEK